LGFVLEDFNFLEKKQPTTRGPFPWGQECLFFSTGISKFSFGPLMGQRVVPFCSPTPLFRSRWFLFFLRTYSSFFSHFQSPKTLSNRNSFAGWVFEKGFFLQQIHPRLPETHSLPPTTQNDLVSGKKKNNNPTVLGVSFPTPKAGGHQAFLKEKFLFFVGMFFFFLCQIPRSFLPFFITGLFWSHPTRDSSKHCPPPPPPIFRRAMNPLFFPRKTGPCSFLKGVLKNDPQGTPSFFSWLVFFFLSHPVGEPPHSLG